MIRMISLPHHVFDGRHAGWPAAACTGASVRSAARLPTAPAGLRIFCFVG
jgi:hypothetical protein